MSNAREICDAGYRGAVCESLRHHCHGRGGLCQHLQERAGLVIEDLGEDNAEHVYSERMFVLGDSVHKVSNRATYSPVRSVSSD